MIEEKQQQGADLSAVSFELVHLDHLDYRPIIEGWPIPRIGEQVEYSGPSPFAEDAYISFHGFVESVKYNFFVQELPDGSLRPDYRARVILVSV